MRNPPSILPLIALCLSAIPAAAQHSLSSATRSTSSGLAASRLTAPAIQTGPSTASPLATAPSTTTSPTRPSPSAPISTTSPAVTVTTSPTTTTTMTTSGAGARGGSSSTPNLGALNPGAQDQNAPTEPNRIASPTGAPGSPTTATGTPTPTTGDRLLGANGVQLPNVGAATSGAVPGQVTTNRGEVNASGGGTARPETGATGRNMTECMSAWDSKTHITKPRWREICARTLTEPHV